ncbi:uncharacterized protein DS421_11g323070 [Arachis hypogaea]|nr:uncharacterized protein DS421_11g323070 [Arachis hypogaea]
MLSTPALLLLKTLALRSNQMFQITAKNAVIHDFYSCFLACMPIQLTNSSFMVLGNTHALPKDLGQVHHTCHVISHRKNKCSTDYISLLHSTQRLSL